MKQLALLNGETIVKRFTLDRESYTIGRSKDTDFTFDHPKVSRTHARLFRENGEYVIQDLNSTNYVFVNGLRIKQKQLAPNDRLQISSEVNLLYLETSPEPLDKRHTLMDIQKHFIHKEDLLRLKKVTQSVVLLNRLDAILLQILKEGIALTNAERGLIVLTDGAEKILWKYATTYRIDKIQAELGEADVSHSILQEALSSKKTVVRANEALQEGADASAQTGALASPPNHGQANPHANTMVGSEAGAFAADSMMSLKIFSAMCAPLVLEEKVIGLFYVDARQLMNNFTEVDQFLFDYLADHAAIAIFNAKRYADQQAEAQRLQLALNELEEQHQELEARHQKLLTQMGQPTKLVKQISTEEAQALTSVTHTYSAGGVVTNPQGQVLLVNQYHTSWSLPKGHIEVGEEPAVTAQREIYEEAGISYLRLVQSLGSYQRYALNKQGHEDTAEMKTIYMYLFHTEQEKLAPQDKDNPEARWFSFAEALKQLSHPKDQAFLEQVLPDIEGYLKRQQTETKAPLTD
jgi:pSer/pThr/pTyr-binding forkhead associated (FHA) protein/8-oxo-dGTP pyrophosphatase MutT (NUDIX family)